MLTRIIQDTILQVLPLHLHQEEGVVYSVGEGEESLVNGNRRLRISQVGSVRWWSRSFTGSKTFVIPLVVAAPVNVVSNSDHYQVHSGQEEPADDNVEESVANGLRMDHIFLVRKRTVSG